MDIETDPMVSSKQGRIFPDAPESPLAYQPNQVYMDCMAFGMGCCCLQITFQAADMSQARFIYDQFAILAPIMVIQSSQKIRIYLYPFLPFFKARFDSCFTHF